MHRVLVLGAGKIGALISGLLADSGDYHVDVADVRGGTVRSIVKAHGHAHLAAFELDASDESALVSGGASVKLRVENGAAAVGVIIFSIFSAVFGMSQR